MAEWTTEQLEVMASGVLELFDDGFQFSDIPAVVGKAMEIAETAGSMTGPEKKELAIMLIGYVIDKTDTPWLPDPLVDPLVKKLVPSLVELVIDASKGRIVNQ
jgi:hypothetical protein